MNKEPNKKIKLSMSGAGNRATAALELVKSGYKTWMEYDNMSSEDRHSTSYLCFEAYVEDGSNVVRLELVFGEGDAVQALAMPIKLKR